MGLGKTVQMLARIVEGVPTAADRKAGFKGTLYATVRCSADSAGLWRRWLSWSNGLPRFALRPVRDS